MNVNDLTENISVDVSEGSDSFSTTSEPSDSVLTDPDSGVAMLLDYVEFTPDQWSFISGALQSCADSLAGIYSVLLFIVGCSAAIGVCLLLYRSLRIFF